jgi:hypothetical protein
MPRGTETEVQTRTHAGLDMALLVGALFAVGCHELRKEPDPGIDTRP